MQNRAELVGRIELGDRRYQLGDLAVVLAHTDLCPSLIGHSLVGVRESGAFGECQRGSPGVGENVGFTPGGNEVEPNRGFASRGSPRAPLKPHDKVAEPRR